MRRVSHPSIHCFCAYSSFASFKIHIHLNLPIYIICDKDWRIKLPTKEKKDASLGFHNTVTTFGTLMFPRNHVLDSRQMAGCGAPSLSRLPHRSFCPIMPVLNVDIIALVVEYLTYEDSPYDALSSAALISRVWLDPTRRALFRKFVVPDPDPDYGEGEYDFSKTIVGCARTWESCL
jgi:hypothetical protein